MTKHIYDLIGDVHGMYDLLCALLEKLEKSLSEDKEEHTYSLIFLGDVIDRGDRQKETFNLVRTLVLEHKATCLMGNHEYNAIMRALGLRKKKDVAHENFLKDFIERSAEYKDAIAFMKTLPFFLELPLFNCVHACYDKDCLNLLRPYLDERNCALNDDIFIKSAKPELNGVKELYDAVEIVLKGTEIDLPEGISYKDKDDNVRTAARTRWWLSQAKTYSEVVMWEDKNLLKSLDIPLPSSYKTTPLLKPVFFGHYWLIPDTRPVPLEECELLKDKAYCLDFSAVRNGALTAMRVITDDEKIEKKEVFSVS